jgi:hypothetical protein
MNFGARGLRVGCVGCRVWVGCECSLVLGAGFRVLGVVCGGERFGGVGFQILGVGFEGQGLRVHTTS